MVTIPDGMRFGFECEVSSGARPLAERLYNMGLLPDSSLHCYHCSCSVCRPDFDRANTFHAQEDCTVAGEFISKPIAWDDPQTHEDIAALSLAAREARVTADSNAGCHVHVSADRLTARHRRHLVRAVNAYQDDFALYAQGKARAVRSYNFPNRKPDRANWLEDEFIDTGGHQSWLDVGRRQTVEFRLWNGTTTDWRIRMYAGLSLATVLAVLDGKVPSYSPRRRLHEFLANYLPDGTADLLERQREYVATLAA